MASALTALSPAPRLALWAGAFLTGSIDAAATALGVLGGDHEHRVSGGPFAQETDLARALGILQQLGAPSTRLLLPVPGDPSGLNPSEPTPSATRAFADAAMEAGEGLLFVGANGIGVGLVPTADRRGSSWVGVHWAAFDCVVSGPNRLPSRRELDIDLRRIMRSAIVEFTQLDAGTVGTSERPSERAAAKLMHPAIAGRLGSDGVALLERAVRVRSIVAAARATSNGALSASALRARAAVLRDLDAVARQALMVVCSTPPATHPVPVRAP